MRSRHPEAPRTVWTNVRDDAPLPPALRVPLGSRAHPTLTALRRRLGPHLDTSGLQAVYVSLRSSFAEVDDQATTRRLLERLSRSVRSDRDVTVDIKPDGAVSVAVPEAPWPLRAGADEWAWVRVRNGTGEGRRTVVDIDGNVRTLQVPAAGSRSYLRRLPTDGRDRIPVTASVDGRAASGAIRLASRPSWPLRVHIDGGPARLSLSDELGPVVPRGLDCRRDLHGRWYVHVRRRVVVPVVGGTGVEARRGPEFEPFAASVTADELPRRGLRIHLRRRFDPAASGWLSADLHAHLHYGGEYLLDGDDAALMQQAEGLWFLNLVVANQESDVVHDRSFFTSTPTAITSTPVGGSGSLTSWGEEFRNDFYGHICLTRPRRLVEPVHSGFRGTDRPFDYPTTVNTAQRSREVGALVSSAHPLIQSASIDDVFAAPRSVEAKELPVLAALGLVDAVDIMSYPGDALLTSRLWYRLLACGFRLAASAGGDAFMNVADGKAFMAGEPGVIEGSGARFSSPVGGVRLYAHAERADRDGLCDAIEAGRTFVTNGPFLGLSVDGHEPGAVIEPRRGARLAIEASIATWVPVGALELVVDGRVRRRRRLAAPPVERTVSWTLAVDDPCTVSLRAIGGPHPDVMDDYVFAHTSPVYVDVDGMSVRDPAAARYFLRWIDRLVAVMPVELAFAEAWQEAEVRGVYAQARAIYAAIGEPG